jgi:hypothetical protein
VCNLDSRRRGNNIGPRPSLHAHASAARVPRPRACQTVPRARRRTDLCAPRRQNRRMAGGPGVWGASRMTSLARGGATPAGRGAKGGT